MSQTLTSSLSNVELESEMKSLIRDYALYLKHQKNRSSRTVEAYCDVVGRLLQSGLPVPGSVRNFLREASSGLSSSSQAQWVSALKNFLLWAESEQKIIDAARLIKELHRPKVSQRMVEIVEEDDLSLVLKTLRDRPPEERLLFELLYGSGLRISEALLINPANFDPRSSELLIKGKGERLRKVPVTPLATEFIKRAKLARATSLWTKKYTVRTFRRWVENWGKISLLDERTGRLHPHKLRHSIASHLLKRGASLPQIQKLLGHKQLSTTQRYTHLNVEDLLKVYDQSFPKLKIK